MQHLVVQALGLCMLVADGGPAHHWQSAGRHGQEAVALTLWHASVAMS